MKPAVVVDVGNTRIKWGRCGADRVVDKVSLPNDDEDAWQRQREVWQIAAGSGWAVSGVDPAQRDKLRCWLQRCGDAVVVLDSFRQLPLSVAVDHPEKVGLDRLLDAVAVNAARPPAAAAVIVDAGTAVTVDYVDVAGTFQGGAILPGLRLMAKALHDHTALLPFVEDFGPAAGPGKNTESAMSLGIIAAAAGGVDRLVQRYRAQSAADTYVYFTGGDAPLLSALVAQPTRLWPELTLEGIRLSAAR